MAAEDYDDVPGIGGGHSINPYKPQKVACKYCGDEIVFRNRMPKDPYTGSDHRCLGGRNQNKSSITPDSFDLEACAVSAMAALITAYPKEGTWDVDPNEIASFAWDIAVAMKNNGNRPR